MYISLFLKVTNTKLPILSFLFDSYVKLWSKFNGNKNIWHSEGGIIATIFLSYLLYSYDFNKISNIIQNTPDSIFNLTYNLSFNFHLQVGTQQCFGYSPVLLGTS